MAVYNHPADDDLIVAIVNVRKRGDFLCPQSLNQLCQVQLLAELPSDFVNGHHCGVSPLAPSRD